MPNRGCLSYLHSWIARYMAKEGEAPMPHISAGKPKAPRRQNSNPRLSCSDVTSTTDISSLSSSLQGANLTVFTTAELKTATRGFSSGSFIGEGGFGPVYKGHLDDKAQEAPQAVAVKVLNLDGMQGHKEWLTEVIMLGQLRHPNLVKLVGYCYEEKHRMLVYEYMERGSLANLLFNGYDPLPWETRIKIAIGAAKGLCFLHEVDQPVIYRDFKASNILLDSDFNAKLADFGLAKDGPKEDETHVSVSVMGTHGYAAPEYIMTGHLTTKSDVYSFGVVLLEMLTGRESVDNSRRSREKCLVEWAKHYLKHPHKLVHIIDPRFEGQYSTKGVFRAAELASQCLNHRPKSRPNMSEVVEVLESILKFKDVPPTAFVFSVGDQGQQSSAQSVASNHTEANKDRHSHDQDQETKKKQEGKMKVHPDMDP